MIKEEDIKVGNRFLLKKDGGEGSGTFIAGDVFTIKSLCKNKGWDTLATYSYDNSAIYGNYASPIQSFLDCKGLALDPAEDPIAPDLALPKHGTASDYVEPAKTCRKDCTPSSPCWTWDVCPVIKEMETWTKVRRDYWNKKKEKLFAFTASKDRGSLPEPMRSGAGGLVCDWILRK